jgi:hypothetical protein
MIGDQPFIESERNFHESKPVLNGRKHNVKNTEKPTGLIVLMPTRGTVAIETMLCLREHLDGYPHKLLTVFRKDVVTARNELAKAAREIDAEALASDPKYCFLTDDDHWWPAGHISRCVGILETNLDVDMVAGIYSLRQVGVLPCLYTFDPVAPDEFTMLEYKNGELDQPRVIDRAYGSSDSADGELTTLAFAEPGWCVVRRDLFERLGPEPFNRIPFAEFGMGSGREFLSDAESFCVRVNRAGGKIVTERSLIVGHVDIDNGLMYLPYIAPRIASGLLVPTQDAPTLENGTLRTYYPVQGAA